MIGFRAMLAAAGRGLSQAASVTWNPDDKGASITLSEGNLRASNNSGAAISQLVRSTLSKTSGKWYFEVTATLVAGNYNFSIGIAKDTASLTQIVGDTTTTWGYLNQGTKYHNGSAIAYGALYETGDVIGVALDLDAGKLWFSLNGVWQASGDPAAGTNEAFSGISGTLLAAVTPRVNTSSGASSFAYSPPSGFLAWNA